MGPGKNHNWNMEPPKMYGGKAISNKHVLRWFFKMKGGYSLGRFNCNKELIPDSGIVPEA